MTRPLPPTAGAARRWCRQNLFKTPLDAAITVVFGAVAVLVIYKAATFVLVTGRWDVVRDNQKVLLFGRFDDIHLLRLSIAGAVLTFWAGAIAGLIHRRRVQAGTGVIRRGWRRVADLAERFWMPALAVVLMLALTTTPGPVVSVLVAVGTGILGRYAGAVAGPVTSTRGGKIAAFAVLAAVPVVLFVYLVDARGFNAWGGFMWNLAVAAIAIVLSFPVGVLLALGRSAGRSVTSRLNGVLTAVILAAVPAVALFVIAGGFDAGDGLSWILVLGAVGAATAGWRIGTRSTMPLLKVVSVALIEIIRGAPLFVLLLLAHVALPFFLPAGMSPSTTTRAIVVFTIFTGVYMSEIVRGGLQSLPPGQSEAARALGLSPVRETFWIVLPQALRNVIPAQIGQIISLTKDTTLAGAAMSVFELSEVSGTLPASVRDLSLVGESLAVAAFLFWVVCYTMSRESQRLEKRLGVGTR